MQKTTKTNLIISPTSPPHHVGVFLDYNAGTVSLFKVTNHGLLICKFSSCSFSQKIDPYFNPMTCTVPMTLCSPRFYISYTLTYFFVVPLVLGAPNTMSCSAPFSPAFYCYLPFCFISTSFIQQYNVKFALCHEHYSQCLVCISKES